MKPVWKLRKRKILRLYSIVHVALETTKTFNFTCQSKSFISIFFTCQVLACELQSFSCHDLTNDIYLQTAKTVLSHLKGLIPLPDVIQPSYEMTPGFKPFPVLRTVVILLQPLSFEVHIECMALLSAGFR